MIFVKVLGGSKRVLSPGAILGFRHSAVDCYVFKANGCKSMFEECLNKAMR